MAKADKNTRTQAARILEAKKALLGQGNGNGLGKFAQATGKATLAKQARKPTRMG
jgi:carbon monoxide dehydrogenase subunit G